jgi:hypothetical protein
MLPNCNAINASPWQLVTASPGALSTRRTSLPNRVRKQRLDPSDALTEWLIGIRGNGQWWITATLIKMMDC